MELQNSVFTLLGFSLASVWYFLAMVPFLSFRTGSFTLCHFTFLRDFQSPKPDFALTLLYWDCAAGTFEVGLNTFLHWETSLTLSGQRVESSGLKATCLGIKLTRNRRVLNTDCHPDRIQYSPGSKSLFLS